MSKAAHLALVQSGKAQANDRLIAILEVEHLTGFKSSKLYQLIREGRFPKPIKLGSRTARWSENKVRQWVQEKLDEAQQ